MHIRFLTKFCGLSDIFASCGAPRPPKRLKFPRTCDLLLEIHGTFVLLSSVALFSSFVVGRPCAVFKHENRIWAYVRRSNNSFGWPYNHTAYCCCFRGSGGFFYRFARVFLGGVLRHLLTVCGSPEASSSAITLWHGTFHFIKRLNAVPGRFSVVSLAKRLPPVMYIIVFKINIVSESNCRICCKTCYSHEIKTILLLSRLAALPGLRRGS